MKEKNFLYGKDDELLFLFNKVTEIEDQRIKEFERFVKSLPLYSPEELFKLLEKEGYRGQIEARKMVCVAIYRHLKRIKMIYENRITPELLPEKVNYIFIGPTGSGKTYIVELLFGKILRIPYVIIDITKYSETGYVGENVINIPYKLIEAARGNKYLAQIGAVIIDEFDKIAGSPSNLRFAGAGTQKDVSGYGVQRELLKLLEHKIFEYGEDHNVEGRINTREILFIALGSFTGFIREIERDNIGFLKEIDENENIIAYKLKGQEEDLNNFLKYGFLPELIARFQRIIPFEALDKNTLKDILDLKLEKLINEFKLEGFDLVLTEKVKDLMVQKALKKGTGARGIESELLKELEKVAFKIFGKNKKGKVIINSNKDKIESKIIFK
ncbi:MAG: AAA family ATPase [Candidatus Hydrothermales bacterium]